MTDKTEVPLPPSLDEVHVFMGSRSDDNTRWAAPNADYYSAAQVQAYGDAREAYTLANLSARPGVGVEALTCPEAVTKYDEAVSKFGPTHPVAYSGYSFAASEAMRLCRTLPTALTKEPK